MAEEIQGQENQAANNAPADSNVNKNICVDDVWDKDPIFMQSMDGFAEYVTSDYVKTACKGRNIEGFLNTFHSLAVKNQELEKQIETIKTEAEAKVAANVSEVSAESFTALKPSEGETEEEIGLVKSDLAAIASNLAMKPEKANDMARMVDAIGNSYHKGTMRAAVQRIEENTKRAMQEFGTSYPQVVKGANDVVTNLMPKIGLTADQIKNIRADLMQNGLVNSPAWLAFFSKLGAQFGISMATNIPNQTSVGQSGSNGTSYSALLAQRYQNR